MPFPAPVDRSTDDDDRLSIKSWVCSSLNKTSPAVLCLHYEGGLQTIAGQRLL